MWRSPLSEANPTGEPSSVATSVNSPASRAAKACSSSAADAHASCCASRYSSPVSCSMPERKMSASSDASAARYGRSARAGCARAIIESRLLHLSPLAGRGEPNEVRLGEGDSPRGGVVESPPHPTPLPASGEREQRGVYGRAQSAPSSRDLPRRAVLGVLEHHAHRGKLIADPIRLLEVLRLARGVTRLDERPDFDFVDDRTAWIGFQVLSLRLRKNTQQYARRLKRSLQLDLMKP